MNKAQLANYVAQKTKISKAKALRAIDETLTAMRSSLKKGERVSLVGFGSFRVKQRKARMGRNPKTGETIQIKARKVATFTASSGLKNILK